MLRRYEDSRARRRGDFIILISEALRAAFGPASPSCRVGAPRTETTPASARASRSQGLRPTNLSCWQGSMAWRLWNRARPA